MFGMVANMWQTQTEIDQETFSHAAIAFVVWEGTSWMRRCLVSTNAAKADLCSFATQPR